MDDIIVIINDNGLTGKDGLGYGGVTSNTTIFSPFSTGPLGIIYSGPTIGNAYSVGSRIRLSSNSQPLIWLEGVITLKNINVINLTVDLFSQTSATLSNWNINLAGEKAV